MKKTSLTILFTIALSSNLFSQSQLLDVVGGVQAGTFYKHEYTAVPLNEIEGTQFINDNFKLGNIEGVIDNVMVRYNAATDEVEFKKNNDVYNLIKNSTITSVFIKDLNYKLRHVNYTNSDKKQIDGYLVEVKSENGISLLRRDKIEFLNAKPARNTYSESIPARFQRAQDEYYLELADKKIILFPKNKKELLIQFPNQKDKIEDFIKKTDFSFKNEAKLIEMTKFIATF